MFASLSTRRARLGPSFGRLRAAVAASSLGDGMRLVALPLLAAQLTADPRQIAAVSLAEQLPWLLFGLLAGALADRWDRRRVLWLVDAARAGVMAALVVATVLHATTIVLLVVVGFLLGCGQALYDAAWSAMVPAVVSPPQFVPANARLQSSSVVAETLVGTPVGAALFGVAVALPLAVDASSFAAAALFVLFVRVDRPAVRDRPVSLRRSMIQGAGWLWRHPLLRRLCLVAGVTNLVGGGLIAMLVLYTRQVLGLSSVGYGLVVASFAVGGLVGSGLAARLTSRLGAGRVLRSATAGTAVAIAVAGAAGSGFVAGAAIAACGAANLVWNVTAVSLRQRLVPDELLGRVTVAYRMVAAGANAIGAAAAGFAATLTDLRTLFFVWAAMLLAATLISTKEASSPE
ncbi:MFS transporter [Kutzneria sp. NPDC052558]|uniref:MFS transporter n=1 Tax=Kutzneria sp. NPDC052558 TaxID=3364121 RepID=UPI0037C7EC81